LVSAITIAFMIGPAIGGKIYSWDKRYPSIAAIILYAINILIVLLRSADFNTDHDEIKSKNSKKG